MKEEKRDMSAKGVYRDHGRFKEERPQQKLSHSTSLHKKTPLQDKKRKRQRLCFEKVKTLKVQVSVKKQRTLTFFNYLTYLGI